jgi:uncharacterized protein (TIGR02646 family)
MRRVAIPPPAPSLATPLAEAERRRVREFYAIPANRTLPFDGEFRAYKRQDVRAALLEAFNGKCAYCESVLEATQPLAVEHYRPKGETIIGGRRTPPGYPWLASTWENLLPSCTDCNSPRKQDFPAGMPVTAGKANQFPLPTERRRATAEGEERRERPLLLHPYFDDPDAHLEYVWGTGGLMDGEIRPRRNGSRPSRRGRTSIEVYALQRLGLVKRRAAHLQLLLAHLERMAEILEDIRQRPGQQRLVNRFQRAVNDVELFVGEDKPYSAMCIQVVAAYHDRLLPP